MKDTYTGYRNKVVYSNTPCVLLADIGNNCNRCPHYIKNPADKPICFKENSTEIQNVEVSE